VCVYRIVIIVWHWHWHVTGHLDKSGVIFEDRLDLSFAAGGNQKGGGSGWVYQLYAVCFHLGSTSNTGHYFAYIKNQTRDQWCGTRPLFSLRPSLQFALSLPILVQTTF
jgi:hypothetical protein